MDNFTRVWKADHLREHPTLKNTKMKFYKNSTGMVIVEITKGSVNPKLTFSDKDFKKDLSGCWCSYF